MNLLYLFGAFAFGIIVGGAVAYHVTSDSYDEAMDASYEEKLDAIRYAQQLEEEVEYYENLPRPVHCPPSVKITSLNMDWEEIDFPNSSEVAYD